MKFFFAEAGTPAMALSLAYWKVDVAERPREQEGEGCYWDREWGYVFWAEDGKEGGDEDGDSRRWAREERPSRTFR